MASQSSKEPYNIEDDDNDTFIDETQYDDHRYTYFDSEMGDGVESSLKRKKSKTNKSSQKKAKIGDNEASKEGNVDKKVGNEGKKVGKHRADCWKHFEIVYLEDKDGVSRKYGRCKYCKKDIKADPKRNGTSGLNTHMLACNDSPVDEKQSKLVFQKDGSGECSVNIWKHDDCRIKKALHNLYVVAELPFKLVENPVFIEYTNALNGKFSLPSRHKLSRDIGKYYIEERNKLLAYLNKPTNTVHLTTDTWTSSCQRANYMVVTAHFIDEDWVLHKRIINFRIIESHRGEDIGQELLHCIHSWGIKNVMTMTVDNASSNDKAVGYLLRKLPNMYDNGKHFHIRCMAHILNLIVKDGLSENNYNVDCLRKAVRYIRNSTQRISTFKKCMEAKQVESTKFLCADMPTRWNSTFEMLKTVVALRDVFFSYELEDASYNHDLERLPEHSDFGACEKLVKFLEKFKIKTDIVSSTSKPLAHLFFREILDVDKHLRFWDCDPTFATMVRPMRKKYDKYWGQFDKLNNYMYFAVILDPTMKLRFVEHCFLGMITSNKTEDDDMTEEDIKIMVKKKSFDLESKLHDLFQTYKERFDYIDYNSTSQEGRHDDVIECDDGNDFFQDFLNKEETQSVGKETELKRYLDEPKVNFSTRFDILKWWKQNAIRFPIVSRMARDILGIQISTVASESAFSTGGRVLDEYRTRLSSTMVEALICTQDWVRTSRKPIVDDVDDILEDDNVVIEIEEAIKKQNEKGKEMAQDK